MLLIQEYYCYSYDINRLLMTHPIDITSLTLLQNTDLYRYPLAHSRQEKIHYIHEHCLTTVITIITII